MKDHSLKRHFTGDCARRIAAMVGERLDGEDFAGAVDRRVEGLELKDRVLVIAEELRERLGGDYVASISMLVDALGPELRDDQGMFTESWYLMPVARFVEEFGLEHPRESLAAIEEITRRHTGEYAIRPYLARWPQLTMDTIRTWAESDSHHVRRLASEGIRPRLPWAGRYAPFVADPRPVIAVLDMLIDDPSLYVRTSVANNLNDISRDHPGLAVETARRWWAMDSERTRWIVTKGLRTLVKQGDPDALEVLGAGRDPAIMVRSVRVTPERVRIGEATEIAVTVANESGQARDVIVDYRIHFRRPDGSLRPATFRLGRVSVAAGEVAEVRKRRTFRQLATRTLHPGEHAVSAQANGNPGETVTFHLLAENSG
ncbi:DNA alkylation repair protein [Corynebacterium sp.]|uniref:DNA alkylation repair protein n=1 Tax=Corynebacterium sp. TaxID=1720 RepID=UPI0026DFE3AA|nr:DNA alkylation repair protein [Corynebacterium sp.]MDO5511462.1 DNA alkylation repair protein [Corynebacterium sp.]